MEGLILIVLMAHEQLHGVETYSPKLMQETTYSVVRHLNGYQLISRAYEPSVIDYLKSARFGSSWGTTWRRKFHQAWRGKSHQGVSRQSVKNRRSASLMPLPTQYRLYSTHRVADYPCRGRKNRPLAEAPRPRGARPRLLHAPCSSPLPRT
jgi:hypothetical protein